MKINDSYATAIQPKLVIPRPIEEIVAENDRLEQERLRRYLPDDKTREDFPLYDGLLAYFPGALCEVARWSRIGNIKHNGPNSPLHWARDKSIDHENKIMRHLLDARQLDENGFVEAVALAWRALALCQTILEERGYPEGANARRQPKGQP